MILKSVTVYVYLTAFLIVLITDIVFCKKSFMNFERPKVLYADESILKDVSFTSRRYNRSNPLYFVSMEYELLQPLDNTFVFQIYVYQLITRIYKQIFLNYSIGCCDLVLVDNFLRRILTEAYYRNPESERPMKTIGCPFSPGRYKLKDMKTTLIDLPMSIPFLEGRLLMNLTHKNHVVYSHSIDFAIKQI